MKNSYHSKTNSTSFGLTIIDMFSYNIEIHKNKGGSLQIQEKQKTTFADISSYYYLLFKLFYSVQH